MGDGVAVPVTISTGYIDALASCFVKEVRAITVERSRYSTSHPIDNVEVRFADGSNARLVCKDLARAGLLPAARRVKPAFVHRQPREPGVYTQLLAPAGLGTAACIAVLRDGRDARWLVLEQVDGVELFQVGDVARWQAAARWAARLHRHFAGRVDELYLGTLPLLRHDEWWVRRWVQRASSRREPSEQVALARVRALAPTLAHRYTSLPRTFVHGELYASNVLVGATALSRVCPIDWEMAAIAPGLVDLAALTAGQWSGTERQSIESAYCDAAGVSHDDGFAEALDVCRLVACVQWLGWAPGWHAPAEHAHPWLDEAMDIADRLGW
jgi:hypothetical protein